MAIGRVTRAGSSTFQYGVPGSAAAGQLTASDEDSGRTSFFYDGFGRMVAKTQTVTGTVNRSFVVRYAYGTGAATGHVASLTYPSGNRIDIAYDGAGRPNSLTLLAADGTTSAPLLTQISYRPFGAVSGWTWGNSTLASPNKYVREFDLEGKLIIYPLGHPSNNGAIRTLHYDAVGRITSITHVGSAQASALDQAYYYDDLDRLTGLDAAAANQRYEYDKNGNRLQVTFGSATYTNAVSATSNRLDATTGPAPAKTNTYDAAGNLLSDGTVRYTYNANRRMDSASAAGITTRYRYNGRGERVIKTSSANTSYYVFDEQGHLLGEYDASGKPIQETVYLGDLPVAVVSPGASGPAITYVYADHLQAPRVLTRASDNRMVWRWDQADPFGLTQPDENPSGLGKFTYNLRFPGQVFDRETNNHYNYFRDYDPQTGRYVQSDLIGLDGGINTYGYVGANPLSLVDPDGLQAIPIPPLPIAPATPGNPNPGLFPGNPTKPWTDIFKPSPNLPTWSLPDWCMSQANDQSTAVHDPTNRRARQYEAAKARCTPPTPPQANCSELSKMIGMLRNSIDRYTYFDAKYTPGRHADKISQIENRIKSLKDRYDRECTSCK